MSDAVCKLIDEVLRLGEIAAQWATYTTWLKPEEMTQAYHDKEVRIIPSADVSSDYDGSTVHAGSVATGSYHPERDGESAHWTCNVFNSYDETEWIVCAPPVVWMPILEPEAPKEAMT
jgi:hypothetical protein